MDRRWAGAEAERQTCRRKREAVAVQVQRAFVDPRAALIRVRARPGELHETGTVLDQARRAVADHGHVSDEQATLETHGECSRTGAHVYAFNCLDCAAAGDLAVVL